MVSEHRNARYVLVELNETIGSTALNKVDGEKCRPEILVFFNENSSLKKQNNLA